MKRLYKLPTIDVKKYGGKQVAIIDGKVIAVGKTSQEIITKVRKRKLSRSLQEITIFSVPKTLAVIYYA